MADEKRNAALSEEWHELMYACNVPHTQGSLHAFAQLMAAYSERHRHYHNLDHIFWMLNLIFDIAYVDPFLLTRNIRLATWYHDVVYDPRGSENEARSAEVAAASLARLGISQETVTRVCDLILMTKEHIGPADDSEAGLFIDADLGILGTDPKEYAEYASGIRKEYGSLADHEFYEGRRKVLQRFQARRRIFRSDWYDRYSESQARANLAAEIAQIDAFLRMLPS
jgi:predicted metal-dependent HD superfamily phosphohydrolase